MTNFPLNLIEKLMFVSSNTPNPLQIKRPLLELVTKKILAFKPVAFDKPHGKFMYLT